MIKHLTNLKFLVRKANVKSAIDRLIKMAESDDLAKAEWSMYETCYNELADILPAIGVSADEDQILAILGESISDPESLNAIGDDYLDISAGDSFLEAFLKAAGGEHSDKEVIKNIAKSLLIGNKDV